MSRSRNHTSCFFTIPLEIREEIYKHYLDVKVNIIFQSRPNVQTPESYRVEAREWICEEAMSRDSLEEAYAWGLDPSFVPDPDFWEEADGNPGWSCPVRFQISPMMRCNMIVSKRFYGECEAVYARTKSNIEKVLDRNITGSSYWSKRFIENPDRKLLDIVYHNARLIFNGDVDDSMIMFRFLPKGILTSATSIFLTRFCLGMRSYRAWEPIRVKRAHDVGLSPFMKVINTTFPELRHLAVFLETPPVDFKYYPRWAPIDGFTMLQNNRIESLELIMRRQETSSGEEFRLWNYLIDNKSPPIMKLSKKAREKEERRRFNLTFNAKKAFSVREVSFAERHGRGIYFTPIHNARGGAYSTSECEEGMVWRIERKKRRAPMMPAPV